MERTLAKMLLRIKYVTIKAELKQKQQKLHKS